MIRSERGILAIRLLACASFALAGALHAGEWRAATLADLPAPAHPPLRDAIAPAPAAVAQGGQLIFIDPATGAISRHAPDVAVLNAASAGLPRVTIDLAPRTTPEGHVYIDTSRLQETATAVIAADGTLHVDCGHPPGHASHAGVERQP